jgi:hypothetical protein
MSNPNDKDRKARLIARVVDSPHLRQIVQVAREASAAGACLPPGTGSHLAEADFEDILYIVGSVELQDQYDAALAAHNAARTIHTIPVDQLLQVWWGSTGTLTEGSATSSPTPVIEDFNMEDFTVDTLVNMDTSTSVWSMEDFTVDTHVNMDTSTSVWSMDTWSIGPHIPTTPDIGPRLPTTPDIGPHNSTTADHSSTDTPSQDTKE